MPAPELPLLLRVADFAAAAHADQRRKGAQARPYINHCLTVASTIAHDAPDTPVEVLCAAILHDVVEDTPVTAAQLRATFGDTIADYVAEVTDDKALPKAERKALQVEHAAHLSPGACRLKLADKISNVYDLVHDPPADWTHARLVAYVDWSEQVVAAMAHPHPALLARFRAVCTEAREILAARAT